MIRRALSALLALCVASSLAQAQVPTPNVIYRVLKIRTPTDTGSAFTLGQQVYFLGYPYGLSTPGSFAHAPPGFGEVPFLKSGIISAMDDRDPEANLLYMRPQQ